MVSFEQAISLVKEKSNLVDMMRGSVQGLRKQGRSWIALCPFHNEKTPSFSIKDNAFYCFGCHKRGDVISYVMHHYGVDFKEAVLQLAEEVGIEVEESVQHRATKPLYGIMENACIYFEQALRRHSQKAIALNALSDRALCPSWGGGEEKNDEVISNFRIGFAPDDDKIVSYLLKKGASQSELEELRITSYGKPFFRNRLIFPIFNQGGKVIGFSGRNISDQVVATGYTPKYLHSKESPIFHKSSTLFGLHQAKQFGSAEMCLVEGNFDVLQMHQHGHRNTVAPLGTSITESQIELLHKFTEKVCFIFDGDRAGIEAVIRLRPMIRKHSIQASVKCLPMLEDPDSFLRSGKTIESMNTKGHLEFCLFQALGSAPVEGLDDGMARVNAAIDLLKQEPNAIEVLRCLPDHKLGKALLPSMLG